MPDIPESLSNATPPDEFDIDWDEVPVNIFGETDEETEDEYADED